jgi:hypothetical protein
LILFLEIKKTALNKTFELLKKYKNGLDIKEIRQYLGIGEDKKNINRFER